MNKSNYFKKYWACYLISVIAICIVVYFIIYCFAQPVTTVLLIRHAEKLDDTGDPPLSEEGELRAQDLVHIAFTAGIEAIFASEALRTQQTVQPLADQLDLSIIEMPSMDVEGLVNTIKTDYSGKVVIIAAHSTTIPMIIEEFGADPVSFMGGGYDNFLIISVFRIGKPEVLYLKYGNPG